MVKLGYHSSGPVNKNNQFDEEFELEDTFYGSIALDSYSKSDNQRIIGIYIMMMSYSGSSPINRVYFSC